MTCPTWIAGLIVATLHAPAADGDGDRFETLTPGAYLRYETGWIDPTAGVFRNSEGDATAFVAGTIEDCTGGNPFFLTIGAAYGYDAAPIAPIAVAGVKLDRLDFLPDWMPPARLGLLPVVEDGGRDGGGVRITGIGVNLSFEFPVSR